ESKSVAARPEQRPLGHCDGNHHVAGPVCADHRPTGARRKPGRQETDAIHRRHTPHRYADVRIPVARNDFAGRVVAVSACGGAGAGRGTSGADPVWRVRHDGDHMGDPSRVKKVRLKRRYPGRRAVTVFIAPFVDATATRRPANLENNDMTTTVPAPVAPQDPATEAKLARRISRRQGLLAPALLKVALRQAIVMLRPDIQGKNPVMFVVEVGTVLSIIYTIAIAINPAISQARLGYLVQLDLWLVATLLFANFASALAEARGKAQADALRKTRQETPAFRRKEGTDI